MLGWAIVFALAALVAAAFGFGSIATAFAGIAQILFYLFLVLFVIALVMSLLAGRSARIETAPTDTTPANPIGGLVILAILAVGVYAWVDNGMSAERLGRAIDHGISVMSADAGQALRSFDHSFRDGAKPS